MKRFAIRLACFAGPAVLVLALSPVFADRPVTHDEIDQGHVPGRNDSTEPEEAVINIATPEIQKRLRELTSRVINLLDQPVYVFDGGAEPVKEIPGCMQKDDNGVQLCPVVRLPVDAEKFIFATQGSDGIYSRVDTSRFGHVLLLGVSIIR
ncbi:MAG: hypothetical protein AAB420_00910 [Patescibacteria group bacterium]